MPEIAGIDQGDALPGPGGIVGDAAPDYAGANYQKVEILGRQRL